MLSIKVNGQEIELPTDFSITINLKSPIFNEVGSSTYPFRINSTPRNKLILNFLSRPENTSDPYREYPCEILWNDMIIFVGLLKCRIANDKSYEGQIYEGRGDFFYAMKNKTLQDFSFGEKIFESTLEAFSWINDCINYCYPDREVAFPQIINENYFEEQPINQDLWRFNKYFEHYGLMRIKEQNYQIIVPCLYFRYVLDILFSQMGYILDDQVFTKHEDFNRLVIYNSVDANKEPIERLFLNQEVSHIYFDFHVPRISLNSFIKGYEDFFFVRHFINNITKNITIKSLDDVILSTESFEFSKNIIGNSVEPEDQIQGYKLSMTTDEGDDTFKDIKGSEDASIERIMKPVETISDLPVYPAAYTNDYRYVKNKQKFYMFNGSTWISMADSIIRYSTQMVIKDKDNGLSTEFSTLHEKLIGSTNISEAVCANKMADWQDISPRLIFAIPATIYDSTMVDEQLYYYYVDIIKGTNNTEFLSLYYSDNGNGNGLATKFIYSFLNWRINAKNIKFNKLMDFLELREFDFSKKYRINGVKYLFKDVQVTLNMNSIQPAVLNGLVCY